MILIQGRSALGAFIRSPLGVRTTSSKYRSDGVGAASAVGSFVIFPTALTGYTTEVDSPTFGTIFSINSTTSQTFPAHIGTNNASPTFTRHRAGFSYPIASYPAGSFAKVNFVYGNLTDGGTSGIKIALSNTDDHTLYTTGSKGSLDWETHFDTVLLRTTSASSTVTFTYNISAAALAAKAGSYFSFLMASTQESEASSSVTSEMNISATMFVYKAS